jgi:hypothetical protein
VFCSRIARASDCIATQRIATHEVQ